MFTFQFQKGNKSADCEDAPPVAKINYSIVCDGLGGAGSTKYTVVDPSTGQEENRTSAYWGSRIVCECVESFFENNINIFRIQLQKSAYIDKSVIMDLKKNIIMQLESKQREWNLEAPRSKALKLFPTTLASSIYLENNGKLTVLVIWAGDSRIYSLSPAKGLQLLSLDDADGSDDNMGSGSAMNNCISFGNDFKINYSIYEFNAPSIIFCCSDGCFDYVASPLHLEWYLLNSICTNMRECTNDGLGAELSRSISESVYSSIGDDTTMAGVCFGVKSFSELKTMFERRSKEFFPVAKQMEENLTRHKKARADIDADKRTFRIAENKIITPLNTIVSSSLKTKRPDNFYIFLTSLPCYCQYLTEINEYQNNYSQNLNKQEAELKEKVETKKRECVNSIQFDHMQWKAAERAKGHQEYAENSKISNINFEIIEQVLLECEKLIDNPQFEYHEPDMARVPIIALTGEKFDLVVTARKEMLLRGAKSFIYNIKKNKELLMQQISGKDSGKIEKKREKEIDPANFSQMYDDVIANPENYKATFLSEKTINLISEYRKILEELQSLSSQKDSIQEQRTDTLNNTFFTNNKESIIDSICKLTDAQISKLFSMVQINQQQLLNYITARRKIAENSGEVEETQKRVESVWKQYRYNYALYKNPITKGVV